MCNDHCSGYDKGERDRFVPTKYVLPDADGCNGCHDGLHVHIDAHRGGTYVFQRKRYEEIREAGGKLIRAAA